MVVKGVLEGMVVVVKGVFRGYGGGGGVVVVGGCVRGCSKRVVKGML